MKGHEYILNATLSDLLSVKFFPPPTVLGNCSEDYVPQDNPSKLITASVYQRVSHNIIFIRMLRNFHLVFRISQFMISARIRYC